MMISSLVPNLISLFFCALFGLSLVAETILHILCEPLRLLWPRLYYISRIWLLRLGYSPLALMLYVTNKRVIATGDEFVVGDHEADSFWPETDGKNKSLVLLNHQAYVDTFFAAYYMRGVNSGDGTMMWVIYRSFLSTPLGWASYMAGHVFLGYGRQQDHLSLERYLSAFRDELFCSFLLYPEGGVNKPDAMEEAKVWARANDLPVFEHLLQPRLGAFYIAVRRLKEMGCEWLYDITIGYPPTTPWGKGDCYNLLGVAYPKLKAEDVHLHIRKFRLDEVGETEAEQRQWLLKLWQSKEKLLDDFTTSHHFPGMARDATPSPFVLWDLVLWMPIMVPVLALIGLAGWRAVEAILSLLSAMFVVMEPTLSTPLGMWMAGLVAVMFTSWARKAAKSGGENEVGTAAK